MKKYTLILLSLLLTSSLSFAQQGFTVKVKIKNFTGDQVRMSYIDSSKYLTIDAVPEKGAWVFRGRVSEPTQAKISLLTQGKNPDFKVIMAGNTVFIPPVDEGFILSNTTLVVKVDAGQAWNYTVKGDAANKEWAPVKKEIMAARKQAWDKISGLYAAFQQNKDSTLPNIMKQERQRVNQAVDTLKRAFITSHPGSYMSVVLLSNFMNDMELDELSAYYAPLKDTWKSTYYGELLVSAVEGGKATMAGKKAPDFIRTTINGAEFQLSSLKGKYVLLDFWGSWCGPCRKSHPHLKEIYTKYKGEAFEIVGIDEEMPTNIEQGRELWKKAVAEDGINWIQVLNHDKDKKLNENIVGAYGITAFPTKILLDKDGIILNRELDNDGLELLLKKIFGK